MTYDPTTYGTSGATSPAKQKFLSSAASQAYKGPSVVDYLNLSGADSSPAGRTKLAGEYGIPGYNTGAGNGDLNTALLAALRGSQTTPSSTSSSSAVTTGSTPTPGGNPVISPVDDVFKTYIDSLSTDKTSDARRKYADFIAARDMGVSNLEGRGLGTPLSLVRGQQSKLMEQSGIEGTRLQNDVTIAQGDQEAARTAAKERLDFEQGKVTRAAQAEKDKRAEDRLANPAFDLSAGQERYVYNSKTGGYDKVASVAPKPLSSSTTGTTRSGTLSYTAQDKAEDSRALETSRGGDGYVDPAIYQNLAAAWTKNGGQIDDFLKEYPPKLYVNPANTTIPPYLRPAGTKAVDDLSWLNGQ